MCVKPCAKPAQPLGPPRDEFALYVATFRRLAGSVIRHRGQAVVEPVPQITEDVVDVPIVQFTPQELCVAERIVDVPVRKSQEEIVDVAHLIQQVLTLLLSLGVSHETPAPLTKCAAPTPVVAHTAPVT